MPPFPGRRATFTHPAATNWLTCRSIRSSPSSMNGGAISTSWARALARYRALFPSCCGGGERPRRWSCAVFIVVWLSVLFSLRSATPHCTGSSRPGGFGALRAIDRFVPVLAMYPRTDRAGAQRLPATIDLV